MSIAMNDGDSKRAGRKHASTLAYGLLRRPTPLPEVIKPKDPQRFAPPPLVQLEWDSRAVKPQATTPGTMAPAVEKRSRRGVFHTIALVGLCAIAIVSNLDLLQGWWTKLVPPSDHVEVSGSIPLMLFVRSNPPASQVFINGRLAGRTPYAQGYGSAGGTVQVRVEAPGHQPWMAKVELHESGVGVNAQLQRLGQKLRPMLIATLESPNKSTQAR